MSETRLIAGCMTGTSIDAVDCALVEVTGTGLAMRARLKGFTSRPLGDLAAPTRALADQQPMTAGQIAALARELALLHVEALRDLLGDGRADLIVLHGQTVYHKPPVTWQLANPAVIAHGLGAPVLSDLRSADVAAGGQGAPITPLADWILLRSPDEDRVVCNLGGFCNLTVLPREEGGENAAGHVEGYDLCPCNHLLDRIARALFGVPFDEDGRRAAAGTVHGDAWGNLSWFMREQQQHRRSLGTGDELDAWIDAWREKLSPNDMAATACAAIADEFRELQTAAVELLHARLLVAGGGSRNRALMEAIRGEWVGEVTTTDEVGLPAQAREAACMAVLGALCEDGVPITLPRVTGVGDAPVAGQWHAGRGCAPRSADRRA